MKEVGFMKKATGVIAAAVAVLTVMPTSEVHAQTSNTIFPEGWDKSVRNRMFMRLGVLYVTTKADSSDAVDLSGPVITRADVELARAYAATLAPTDELSDRQFTSNTPTFNAARSWNFSLNSLVGGVPEMEVGAPGMGTPPGIKAKMGDVSTVALSLGYWLTEEFSWMLEVFLLAKPPEVKGYGSGTNQSGSPIGLNGKHILSTKILSPIAILSRHFGSTNATFRPFVGLGAMYAFFYDAKTTDFYDSFVGGKTSVNIKNALGVGPFVGLTSRLGDSWHVNVQVGQVRFKTTAILTTRNTNITSRSGVLADFSEPLSGAIELAHDNYDPEYVTKFMKLVLAARNAQPGATQRSDFGSFSRKQENMLKSTIINVSVGYSF